MVSRFSGKVFTTERGIPRNGVCCSKSSVGTEWEVFAGRLNSRASFSHCYRLLLFAIMVRYL